MCMYKCVVIVEHRVDLKQECLVIIWKIIVQLQTLVIFALF